MNERMNVRRMQVPDKDSREKLAFDARREVTPDDWRGMQRELKEMRNSGDWPGFASLSAHMKILDSSVRQPRYRQDAENLADKVKEFTVAFDQITFEMPSEMKLAGFTDGVMNAERESAIRARLNGFKDSIKRGTATSADASDIYVLACIKILKPQMQTPILADKAFWEKVEWYLQQRRDVAPFGAAMQLADLLRDIKILYPERQMIHVEEWGPFRDELEKMRQQGQWPLFAKLAASMKILAAKDVHITENGIELEMTTPELDEKLKPIPDSLEL